MLILSTILIILSNAVSVKRDSSILYTRIVIFSLIYTLFLINIYINFYVYDIALYSNLFKVNNTIILSHLFIVTLTILILFFSSFKLKNVYIINKLNLINYKLNIILSCIKLFIYIVTIVGISFITCNYPILYGIFNKDDDMYNENFLLYKYVREISNSTPCALFSLGCINIIYSAIGNPVLIILLQIIFICIAILLKVLQWSYLEYSTDDVFMDIVKIVVLYCLILSFFNLILLVFVDIYTLNMDGNLDSNNQNSNIPNNVQGSSSNSGSNLPGSSNSGSNLPGPLPLPDVSTPHIALISGVTLIESPDLGAQYHKYIFDDNDPTCQRMLDHMGLRYKRTTLDTSLHGPRKVLLHDAPCDKPPSGLHSVGIRDSVNLGNVTTTQWGSSVTMTKMVNGTEKSVLAFLPNGSTIAPSGHTGATRIKVPFL